MVDIGGRPFRRPPTPLRQIASEPPRGSTSVLGVLCSTSICQCMAPPSENLLQKTGVGWSGPFHPTHHPDLGEFTPGASSATSSMLGGPRLVILPSGYRLRRRQPLQDRWSGGSMSHRRDDPRPWPQFCPHTLTATTIVLTVLCSSRMHRSIAPPAPRKKLRVGGVRPGATIPNHGLSWHPIAMGPRPACSAYIVRVLPACRAGGLRTAAETRWCRVGRCRTAATIPDYGLSWHPIAMGPRPACSAYIVRVLLARRTGGLRTAVETRWCRVVGVAPPRRSSTMTPVLLARANGDYHRARRALLV
jgi:hypothetical protein